MPTAKTSVYKFFVSDAAFKTMARAISALSIKNRRFETLREVVQHVLDSEHPLDSSLFSEFAEMLPLDGETRIFVRIDRKYATTLDELRTKLSASTDYACSAREIVCFCCYVIGNGLK